MLPAAYHCYYLEVLSYGPTLSGPSSEARSNIRVGPSSALKPGRILWMCSGGSMGGYECVYESMHVSAHACVCPEPYTLLLTFEDDSKLGQ